jgi:hypothetical protein
MAEIYFSGQGKLLVAPRLTDGSPGKFRWVGNVPELVLTPNRTTREKKESYTGQRSVDLRLTTEMSVGFRFVLERFSKENLALGLYGASYAREADTGVAHEIPTLEVGGIYALPHAQVSSVVIADSTTPTPVTLDEYDPETGLGDYIVNAAHGSIEIVDLPTVVAPFDVTYNHAAQVDLSMFTQPAPERFYRFEGLNTAQGNQPVVIELYRGETNPFSEVPMINDEEAQMPVEGVLLVDSARPTDAELGQFGRIVLIEAVA